MTQSIGSDWAYSQYVKYQNLSLEVIIRSFLVVIKATVHLLCCISVVQKVRQETTARASLSVWDQLTFQHSCVDLGSVSQRLVPFLGEVMGIWIPDLLQWTLSLMALLVANPFVSVRRGLLEGSTNSPWPPEGSQQHRSAPGAAAVCGVKLKRQRILQITRAPLPRFNWMNHSLSMPACLPGQSPRWQAFGFKGGAWVLNVLMMTNGGWGASGEAS